MKAMYEARLENLTTGDLVVIECVCGHTERLTAAMLKQAGVKAYDRIMDLSPKLRCRECDERGKVLVSIRWTAN